MGVIQKKASDRNDKKKNKVKNNMKSKLETNMKFPKAKNSENPTSLKIVEKVLGPKKKQFEKKLNKGNIAGTSKSKQEGTNTSPNNKKNKKKWKQSGKPVKTEVKDTLDETPLTEGETEAAIKIAKTVKKDSNLLDNLLTNILKSSNMNKEDHELNKPIAEGLQLEELISKQKLKQYVKSFMRIIKNAKAQPEYKSKLINDKRILTLSVLAMKVPECTNKNAKIKLPFPLYTTDSEICLFVADLERGRKRDDEPFVRHYEELLEKNGVTSVNKIITTSHLIKEYSTYELRERLANTYDVFLVETKVINRVGKFLGKTFANLKKNPIVIKDFTNDAIETALTTVTYRQSGLGPVNVINFAYDTMPESEITENLYNLIQQLKKIYPGGWTNIRSLTLTALKDLAYPIMYNFASSNDIPVPKVKSIRDLKVEKTKALLNGALHNVEITGDGVLKKIPLKRKLDEDNIFAKSVKEEQTEEKQVKIEKDGSPPKSKKNKKKSSKEPETVIKIEPKLEDVSPKKDKKKQKMKNILKNEPESVEATPEPVELVKKKKKTGQANFNKGLAKNDLVNKKLTENSKFEKNGDEVKPKKKKFNKN